MIKSKKGRVCTGGAKRIIATDDCGFLGGFPTTPMQEHLDNYVGIYADKGIDAVSFDFIGEQLASYDNRVCEPPPLTMGWGSEIVKHFIDTEVDVLAETCHCHGLQYWAAARMNASATYLSRTPKLYPAWFIFSPVRAVFIRAPYVTRVWGDAVVLATFEDKIVMVRQDNLLTTAFHPELTEDRRIQQYFFNMIHYKG